MRATVGTVAAGETDALGAFIGRLRFAGGAAATTALALGDRQRFEPPAGERPVVLHHVISGSVSLCGDEVCGIARTGDVVVLPGGGAHSVTALDGSELLTLTLRPDLATLAAMGGLPALLTVCCLSGGEPFVGAVLEQLVREHRGARAGATTLIDRLAELVLASAVRTWAEAGAAGGAGETESVAGRSVALRDPHVARAVEAIHARPGEAWTVAGLARLARSSRSVFAAQFRVAVGATPLEYLGRVRMDRAKELLVPGGPTVGRVAEELGYRSDEAFSRAFRRAVGVSPTQWRRDARPAPRIPTVTATVTSAPAVAAR
ncbi:AraC family transcriptional regulator [Herbiconiux moechotypicola]|uniref:HTH araC/xylS-type domain-containing protein n=1 Tax=Herbiconiux moechotypicola TaxID=637393 RepID=A0ABN3E3E3_9MICO|nr:AraC family transcriptional regulator [Herbiconiux moechotypicola]MCS5731566.1 AraC family transcriptional regulator [Herbiconiux moechotypicola]